MMFGVTDVCPFCGSALTGRTLGRSTPGDRACGSPGVELRRCGSCRHLALRTKGGSNEWVDAGLDPSIDYLFDWQAEPLPSPWGLVPAEQRAALEAELSVEADLTRFVSVHLTWRGASEQHLGPGLRRCADPCHAVSPGMITDCALRRFLTTALEVVDAADGKAGLRRGHAPRAPPPWPRLAAATASREAGTATRPSPGRQRLFAAATRGSINLAFSRSVAPHRAVHSGRECGFLVVPAV